MLRHQALSIARRSLSTRAQRVLDQLHLNNGEVIAGVYDGQWRNGDGGVVETTEKATGEVLARVATGSAEDCRRTIGRAREAYASWRMVPAPKRGEIIRQIRNKLADNLDALGSLVSLEMGKIKTEGDGEVQEVVDICDFAVGLSRTMGGSCLPSERPGHILMEVPNPLGVVGVISANNFPAAVYGWNLALSMVSGNGTVWTPSPTTPLISIATTRLIASVLEQANLDGAIASLVCGGPEPGQVLVANEGVELISFTGSEATGRRVGQAVASRFGLSILELGGNNAAVVMPDADLQLAVRTVVFGAVGTAGQRCTSTRRLFLHESIANDFLGRLTQAYGQLIPSRMGHPLDDGVLCGPLHSMTALHNFERTIAEAKQQGGQVIFGGAVHEPADAALRGGAWAMPTVIRFGGQEVPEVMKVECFAPILTVKTFKTLDEAIALNNGVPQGLSSTIFTQDVANLFKWTGPAGSDAGIVNLNTSTSGAEIALPFGGNGSTGHGRESGGDAWKQYSRWSSCTLNFSGQLPLAQGVSFD